MKIDFQGRRMTSSTVCLLAVLLWSSILAVKTCVLNETGCGVPTQRLTGTSASVGRKRVVKGTPTTTRTFPWMVMIRRSGEATVKCGGAILCDNIVLTAAHCFDDGTTPFELFMYVGKDEMDYYNVNQAINYVKTIVIHPSYDSNTMANDIAIIRTESPFRFNNNVKPICLPNADEVLHPGQTCLFTGYGDTLGIGFARRLNYVEIPLINDADCAHSDWLGPEFDALRNVSFCAGHANGGPDGCTGDSGGPLVCLQTGNTDKYMVYGVSSWGRGCGERHSPGVYTRVSHYLGWIKSQTQVLLLG